MFFLEKAAIYQSVFWGRFLSSLKLFKRLCFVGFVIIFLLFLYAFLTEAFSQRIQSLLLGLSIITFALSLSGCLKEAFFNEKIKKPRLRGSIKEALANPDNYNLAEFLSFEVAKAASLSKNDSTVLLYNLLSDNPKLSFIFSRALLSVEEVKEVLRKSSKKSLKDLEEVVLLSLKTAEKNNHLRVEVGDMLVALAGYNPVFKRILVDANLKCQDIENLASWLEFLEDRIARAKRFWAKENLIRKGTLAKQWTAGYTVTLDSFSVDLTEAVKRAGFPETIGHQKEGKLIERVLSRGEVNNVLLVGEPGAGKKAIIQGLAARSALGQAGPETNYKRVMALDIPAILSQSENREEIQAILDNIFREAIKAGNVILTINDFHNFVRKESSPGLIDISGILSSYLSSPQLQLIAVTSYQGLHQYIERSPGVLDLFEKVEVSEIAERETLMLLERMTLFVESKYKKFVSYPALREIIGLSQRYLPALPFPKKAVSLLDEVMVYASSLKEKVVLPEHVAKVVSEKTGIPVGEIKVKEKEVLLNLEKLIHQRIINQEEAVKEVSAALRRARAEVTSGSGPMGTFLFLGPTGVGKTETSKALAEIYFGSERRMIRMDMSEFQNIGDIARLIGSATEDGLLTTQVRENPFSLILLDELEKAHKNVLNLFLRVLDEWFLTDGLGRKVDFKNTIIIATSNAGYQIILKALREKTAWSKVKQGLLDHIFDEAIFRPEFINRFDAVVIFQPLSKENLLDIAQLMLLKLKKNLEEKGVEFVITKSLKEKIVELGYDPTFGARQMKRVIQDKVENVLASALLSDKLKRGDKVEVNSQDFSLKIS